MPSVIPLNVPEIGDAEKIELVAWRVSVGQHVQSDQEICELVTDKAAFPLESPASGKIVTVYKSAGENVRVGETLALLELDSE